MAVGLATLGVLGNRDGRHDYRTPKCWKDELGARPRRMLPIIFQNVRPS
jgi:hypothetical protein